MAFQTGLEGKPWYWGVIVGLLAAGVFYFAGHQILFQDQLASIEGQESRLTELQTQLVKGQAAQRQLPQFRQEVARLEEELQKLKQVLPPRRDTPELMRRVRLLTEMGDFELLRFRPRGESDQGFYSEWPISVEMDGSYHNLAIFFDRISRLPRIVNVENLRVQAKEGHPFHTLATRFTVKTFVYKEGSLEEQLAAGEHVAVGGAP